MNAEITMPYLKMRDPNELKVAPIGHAAVVKDFASEALASAIAQLDSETAGHAGEVGKFAAAQQQAVAGEIPLDNLLNFARELGEERLQLAARSVALIQRRLELRAQLATGVAARRRQRRAELTTAVQAATAEAARIWPDGESEARGKFVCMTVDEAEKAWRREPPHSLLYATRDDADLVWAKRRLGLALVEVSACGVALPEKAMMPV